MNKNYNYKNFIKHPFYTEGPVVDAAGNWFFTDLNGGSIIRIAPDGVQSIWAKTTCPNGQALLSNEHHIICDSALGLLKRFDSNGIFIENIIEQSCAGECIHTPNDVIQDNKGNIYFTDSIRLKGKVGYISISGKERIIARDLDYPNGLALSKNGQYLFVAESYQNRILAFHLNNEGIPLTEFSVIANLPTHPSKKCEKNLPDGIKVDQNGMIWVAHYGMGMVHQLSPEGDLLRSIDIPFDLVSNLFIQNNTLIVTGGYSEPGPGGIIEIEL
jgi:gluconolactonase